MNKAGMLGIAVLIIIIASATYRFFEQRKQRISDDNSPVKLYMVEVVDKQQIPKNDRRSRENDVNGPETTYVALEMKGRLFMQGSRFVQFETDAPDNESGKTSTK